MESYTWIWAIVWSLIPIAFIVTWAIRRTVPASRGVGKKQMDELRAQIAKIDERLSDVEKTINDIP